MELLIKRGFDIFLSLLAILLLAPLFILVGLGIYLEDRGPILYRQQRVGKNKKLFMIYKFRSMRVNNINPLTLGPVKHGGALVTKIGYLLRRFKLDETPQFFNVLWGEMSLIGPRPCLPERLTTMSPAACQRFDMLPGLSGWAEVNGNVELSWDEQVLLDVWYVKHWRLRLDLTILLRTLYVVLFGSKRNETALADARKFICAP